MRTVATSRPFVVRNLQRLRLDRVAIVDEPVTAAGADRVITRMLELAARDTANDICLLISSPGGDLKAGLAIYEAMKFTACDVMTIAVGYVASVAALLLAAGSPGKRIALSTGRIALHPPSLDLFHRECERHGAQMERTLALVYRMLAELTGQSPRSIADAAERESILTALEAQALGLVDHVDRLPDAPGAALRSHGEPRWIATPVRRLS